MRRIGYVSVAATLVIAGLFTAFAVSGGVATTGTVTACATSPTQTINANGVKVGTITPKSACATATYTVPTVTETVTTTAAGTTTAPVTTAPVTTAPATTTTPVPAGPNFAGTFDCYGSTPSCQAQNPVSCTKTITSGLVAAITTAAAGDVICINASSIAGGSLTNITKTSDVTIQPAPGIAVTISSPIILNASTHLHFTGVGGGSASMSVSGASTDGSSGCSSNITFDHITFVTEGVNVMTSYACSHDLAILFDHDRFDNLPGDTWEGRVNIQGLGIGPTSQPNGVTISNSHFGGSGDGQTSGSHCSDGINVLGDTYGTVIGPGNEFTGMDESSCAAHVDTIQGVGSTHTTIVGNYFHDNVGSAGPQHGPGDSGWTIQNNVFVFDSGVTPERLLCAGCGPSDLVSHNTFWGGQGIFVGRADAGTAPSATVRDNVFVDTSGIAWDGNGTLNHDHNVHGGLAGTTELSGTATLVSSPGSGYYHYQLDPSSVGYHAASDGKSVGITP